MSIWRTWRPYRTVILIVIPVLILVGVAVSFMSRNFHHTAEVQLGSAMLSTRVASTDQTREQGLSGVDKLNPFEGLLMVFDRDDTWGIWMKDMEVPIDIVWLNSDKDVIYIVKNASPELGTSKTFAPGELARYVIEVPAGTVESSGIKIGANASFNVDGSQ